MNLAGQHFADAAYWTEWDERGERLIIRVRRGWKAIRQAALGFAAAALVVLIVVVMQWDRSEIRWNAETIKFGFSALIFVPSLILNLFAREMVMFDRGMLVHRWEIAGWGRSSTFDRRSIFLLRVNDDYQPAEQGVFVNPLKDLGKVGAIRFSSGSKTHYLGASLDSAEAQQVVMWLSRRLPRGAEEY